MKYERHMLVRIINLLKKLLYSQKRDNNIISHSHYNFDNCNPEMNGEYFFLNTYAKSFNLCLDVGANQGCYSEEILRLNPKSRVISFEPNKSLIPIIRSRGIKEVYPYAINRDDSNLVININKSDSSQSSIFRKNSHTIPKKVPGMSLDSFCNKNRISHISFIKIDTEGNELAVLQGAKQMLKKQAIDYIQFEYGGTFSDAGTTLKEIYSILKKKLYYLPFITRWHIADGIFSSTRKLSL